MGSDLINFGNMVRGRIIFWLLVMMLLLFKLKCAKNYTPEICIIVAAFYARIFFLPINTIHITLPYTLVDVLYNGQ